MVDNPQDPCMLYMVTFTINIPQMLAYIPYMDPMGNGRYSKFVTGLINKRNWGAPHCTYLKLPLESTREIRSHDTCFTLSHCPGATRNGPAEVPSPVPFDLWT